MTQNQNEVSNGTIWNRIPKYNKYAAVHFNVGDLAALQIYDKLNVERGFYTTKGNNWGKLWSNNTRRKGDINVKERRKILRDKDFQVLFFRGNPIKFLFLQLLLTQCHQVICQYKTFSAFLCWFSIQAAATSQVLMLPLLHASYIV